MFEGEGKNTQTIEAYMIGHARMMAGLELSRYQLIEEETSGKLIRIERAEALELFASAPIELDEESKCRLETDGFLLTARLLVKDSEFVWAVFSPNEEAMLKDLFVRVKGPSLAPTKPVKRSGLEKGTASPWCGGCWTGSTSPCDPCKIEDLPAPGDFDFLPLIDFPFGKLIDVTIPLIPQSFFASEGGSCSI